MFDYKRVHWRYIWRLWDFLRCTATIFAVSEAGKSVLHPFLHFFQRSNAFMASVELCAAWCSLRLVPLMLRSGFHVRWVLDSRPSLWSGKGFGMNIKAWNGIWGHGESVLLNDMTRGPRWMTGLERLQ